MGLPQIPDPAVARQLAGIIGDCPGPTVLLGVTTAFAGLGDPLLAFDSAPGMIAQIWPGDDPGRKAVVADWRALPIAGGMAGRVLGDGSLNVLPDRVALRDVLREVRRILAPTGLGVIRTFVRPDPEESLEQVIAAAHGGNIPSLNVLRWRLAAALAVGPDHIAPVAAILSAAETLGDLADFAREKGMDPAQAEHLLAYAGSPVRYVFPDRASLAADARAEGLSCDWVETQGYPGARDCPFALFRHKP